MSPRRFRVPAIPPPGEWAPLPGDVAHHATHVLRLAPGTPITLFDGSGLRAPAVLAVDPNGEVGACATDWPAPTPEPQPAWLLLGLIKPGPLDDALRMATEAGATRIVIFLATRSQARPARDDRWRRVVEAAARQCGRPDDPPLGFAGSLSLALDQLPGNLSLYVASPGSSVVPPPTGPAAIAVGPEGGLTEAEVVLLQSRAALPVTLGPWILRAETAAACATAWMTSAR